ncbi:MAG: MarR family transcriptional regulator [Pseudomonadota bacterium]
MASNKERRIESTSDAGLEADPIAFKVMTEIDMIASMATTVFERLLPENLTSAQFGVLNRLARLGMKETVSELAVAFMVAQPTMSSTVKKLVAKRFVTMRVSKTDGRVKHVAITKRGLACRERTVQSLSPLYAMYEAMADKLEWAPMLMQLNTLRHYLETEVYGQDSAE